jgi:hypothetical protein
MIINAVPRTAKSLINTSLFFGWVRNQYIDGFKIDSNIMNSVCVDYPPAIIKRLARIQVV